MLGTTILGTPIWEIQALGISSFDKKKRQIFGPKTDKVPFSQALMQAPYVILRSAAIVFGTLKKRGFLPETQAKA